MTKKIQYTSTTENVGKMRCHTTYPERQGEAMTDIPTELGGKGEFPTPGMMLAACLASCMLSMVSYKAQSKGLEPKGFSIRASAEEGSKGIASLHCDIYVTVPTTPEQRKVLEAAAHACPVGNAIHPDIKKVIHWNWA